MFRDKYFQKIIQMFIHDDPVNELRYSYMMNLLQNPNMHYEKYYFYNSIGIEKSLYVREVTVGCIKQHCLHINGCKKITNGISGY